jgi:uncharacterized protein (TIGR03437 family)
MKLFGRIAMTLAGLATAVTPISAYYHYVHYNAAGQAIFEKFDLSTLPNQTVTYFVTNSGPTIYPQNDSFSSVLSQVNQAISTWNLVGTSSIRLAFGGLFNPNTPLPATPGGQVEFVQLPPGYYGMGGPMTSTAIAPNAQFVPILRSMVYLTTDLTQKPGPSYTSTFFLTTVHEIGHSLGLQHTYTSSAMSTAATRATSLTKPIDADDIAGLSVLYPANGFSQATGTLSGRVTANGAGVHMASVVAIRDGYGAVSTLTNPDGTFEIDGVPPGSYFLYAHPLPTGSTSSCLDICVPIDSNGKQVSPSGPFNTVFLNAAIGSLPVSGINIGAGQTIGGLNFAVQPRNTVPIYDVSIFSFYGNNPVSPGFLNVGGTQGYGGVLAGGTGLTAGNKVAAGLTAQIMGGSGTVYAVAPYTDPNGYTYLNIGVQYALGASVGQHHLIFNQGGYTYVLPSALNLVKAGAPTVTSVAPNPDGSVAISGTNFASDSLVYFDGLPAAIRSINAQTGQAVVLAPPGASGQQATVIVYNHDGQNSLFVQQNSPVTYPYPASPTPAFTISPSTLPAGSEALVTITGTNTNFVQGQTVVGFGSSDVYVRSAIVQPNTQTILVDVSIPASAVNTSLETSVIAGFQIATLPNAFQITPPTPLLPAVIPSLQNVTAGQTGSYPGALVSFTGSNLQVGNTVPAVTINGSPVTILAATANSVTLQLPTSLATGAAILNVNNGTATSYPVAVSITPLPATITSIVSGGGSVIGSSNPASGDNEVDLFLSGFGDPTAVILPQQVSINVGGVNHPAVAVDSVGGGLFEVRFVLSKLVPTGSQTPITVYLNGNSSYTSTIATANY